MTTSRTKLVELVANHSYIRGDFKLSSGRESRFYLDAKQVTYRPKGARWVGEAVLEQVQNYDAVAVGGLTMGADPIVTSAVLMSDLKGSPISGFVVRKEAKRHGLQKWIEGMDPKGHRVVIVDDVVTSGGSVLTAVDRARAAGADVAAVVCLVDREQGGADCIRKTGIDFIALCSISEVESFLEASNVEHQPSLIL